jgi:hypothetical protein
MRGFSPVWSPVMDLSKELKENIAVSQDRVSCLVDVISDRFDHQFAVVLTARLRGLVFFGRCIACPQTPFSFIRGDVRLFADMDGLIFAAVSVFYGHKYIIVVFFIDIVFIDKGKGLCVCGKGLGKCFPHLPSESF